MFTNEGSQYYYYKIDNIQVAADFRVLPAALSQNNTLNKMNSIASKSNDRPDGIKFTSYLLYKDVNGNCFWLMGSLTKLFRMGIIWNEKSLIYYCVGVGSDYSLSAPLSMGLGPQSNSSYSGIKLILMLDRSQSNSANVHFHDHYGAP